MKFMLIAALLVCTGCATTYHDQGAFKGKGGFSDSSSAPNQHTISYIGGNTIDTTVASVFGLRRAAELAKADGKPGFVVKDGHGKVMASTMTTIMNGVMSQSTSYTPSVDLNTESSVPPEGDSTLTYFDADTVLRLTEPYVTNGEKLTSTLYKLNERLEKAGSAQDPALMQDLYSSLIFSTNLGRDDVQFRQGYLVGMFRNKDVAREWAGRDYLPTGQTMIAVALQMNNHKDLLADFAHKNHWPAKRLVTMSELKAGVETLKLPLAQGMRAATGDAGITVQRNSAIYTKLLETYAALLDTTKPGPERALSYVNISRLMEVLEKENPGTTAEAVDGLQRKLEAAQIDISRPVMLKEMLMLNLSNKVGAMPVVQLADESNARQVLLKAPDADEATMAVILHSADQDEVRVRMELYTPSGKKHVLAYGNKVKGVKDGYVRYTIKAKGLLKERGIYRLTYGVRTGWLADEATGNYYFPKM